MTPFEQKLAAYQQYIAKFEPGIADQVNAIISKYYSSRVGFGDAASDAAFNASDAILAQGTADGLISAGSTPAIDTSNILGNLVNAGASFLNNQVMTQQQTQQLQLAAATAAAKASASGSTTNTALLVMGGIGLIVALALMTNRRHP